MPPRRHGLNDAGARWPSPLQAFRRADHDVAVALLKEAYPDYETIHFSNEGY